MSHNAYDDPGSSPGQALDYDMGTRRVLVLTARPRGLWLLLLLVYGGGIITGALAVVLGFIYGWLWH